MKKPLRNPRPESLLATYRPAGIDSWRPSSAHPSSAGSTNPDSSRSAPSDHHLMRPQGDRLQARIEELAFEKAAMERGFCNLAGVDEAGRGPLAGPVVAAACIIPPGVVYDEVNDSKKLTRETRKALYKQLTEDPRITFGLGSVDAPTIDKINILQATIRAMLEAVEKLSTSPDCLLVDGLQLPHPTLHVEKIIKGDEQCHAIACASILAKECRDRMMEEYAKKYPEYGFHQHKGYGTPQHLAAIEKHGLSPIHRRSFRRREAVVA